MGTEYNIKCLGLSDTARDRILRAAPHFARYLSEYRLYEYRSDTNQDERQMPNAYAAVETDGFYFCDNGSRLIVTAILAYLQSQIEASGQPFDMQSL